MKHPEREALLKEGKSIVERTNEDSWRLADIVRKLYDGGMLFKDITEEFGWKNRETVTMYVKADRKQHPRFADAFLYAGISADRTAAVQAIVEAEGISPNTANRSRRPVIKEIVAKITDLPEDKKREIAREIAQDAVVRNEVVGEAKRQLDKQRKAHRRDSGLVQPKKTGLEGALSVVLCQSIEDDLDHLVRILTGDEDDDVKKVVREYIEAFALQGQVILSTLGKSESWDEALKEIA